MPEVVHPMKMSTGKVIDGKVVVEGVELVEGSTVIVLEEDDEVVELTAEQEAELETASDEIKRGNFVTPEELFEMLRKDREGARAHL